MVGSCIIQNWMDSQTLSARDCGSFLVRGVLLGGERWGGVYSRALEGPTDDSNRGGAFSGS